MNREQPPTVASRTVELPAAVTPPIPRTPTGGVGGEMYSPAFSADGRTILLSHRRSALVAQCADEAQRRR
jgi:hypothetical protein